MSVIEVAGVRDTVKNIGLFYPSLVREFLCCMDPSIDQSDSRSLYKVKLRGFTYSFSPSIINKHFKKDNSGITGATVHVDHIVEKLTGGLVKRWLGKNQKIPAAKLSFHHAILHKVLVQGILPTNHHTSVSESQARVLSMLTSERELNIGQVVFEQVVAHAKSVLTQKPIGFPSMIYSILISQNPGVLAASDIRAPAAKPFSINRNLLKAPHVKDINFGPDPRKASTSVSLTEAQTVLRICEEELDHLDVFIQQSLARKKEIERKIVDLKENMELDDVDPEDDTKVLPASSEHSDAATEVLGDNSDDHSTSAEDN